MDDLGTPRTLLTEADTDRVSTVAHNLAIELAALTGRLAALEAKVDGRPPPTPTEVQALVAAVMARVLTG